MFVSAVDMNTPAAAEHTAKIERLIRMIKEHCSGILCTLPYKALPQQILTHLLHFVVMWLNNFPLAISILSTFSPHELILRNCLNYNKHCHTPFGAYCETHEENSPTNSMALRNIPSTCLGPTGNLQGSYYFFSLITGKIIKRRHWDELPVPQSVIDPVAYYANKSGSPPNLIFAHPHHEPYNCRMTLLLVPKNNNLHPIRIFLTTFRECKFFAMGMFHFLPCLPLQMIRTGQKRRMWPLLMLISMT